VKCYKFCGTRRAKRSKWVEVDFGGEIASEVKEIDI
jgi:hypothetical protein